MTTSLLIAAILSSCAKKEPEVAPTPAPVKRTVTHKTTESMPQADADLELANELRDPDLLQQLDPTTGATGSSTPVTNTNVRPVNQPVVIKGSDAIPEIPQPTTPPPNPPIPAPKVPAIDANTTKNPGSAQ